MLPPCERARVSDSPDQARCGARGGTGYCINKNSPMPIAGARAVLSTTSRIGFTNMTHSRYVTRLVATTMDRLRLLTLMSRKLPDGYCSSPAGRAQVQNH